MFNGLKERTAAIAAAAVLALGTAGGIAAMGSSGADTATSSPPRAPTAQAVGNPIPQSVLGAESAAEDTIDLMLAGETAKAIDAAYALDRAAQGRVAKDLAAAGIPEVKIAEFQSRAAAVARLAPTAAPLQTALASNRAFALVSQFLASYEDAVPAEVIRLDYLDFEAKLQALAGDRPTARAAVTELATTWKVAEPEVIAAGGTDTASAFSAHVASMQDLVRNGSGKQLASEAQNGLDLVDQIEAVYTG